MTKHAHSFTAIAVATVLGLGLSANVALAASQTAPNGDESSSMGQAVSDTWITTKVKTELATTKGVDSVDVSVTTTNGVVTLTGDLPTDVAVEKAVAAARSIDGVKKVDSSGLKVKGEAS